MYASPAFGFAQVALAIVAKRLGRPCHIFTARRQHYHPASLCAHDEGAVIHGVKPGYLSVVQARARQYAEANDLQLVPFGCDSPVIVDALAAYVRNIPEPPEVWVVAGSGTIARGLMAGWPNARFNLVQIGRKLDDSLTNDVYGLYRSPYDFDQPCRDSSIPCDSNRHYDAKAWDFILKYACDGALFWNVAGNPYGHSGRS